MSNEKPNHYETEEDIGFMKVCHKKRQDLRVQIRKNKLESTFKKNRNIDEEEQYEVDIINFKLDLKKILDLLFIEPLQKEDLAKLDQLNKEVFWIKEDDLLSLFKQDYSILSLIQ